METTRRTDLAVEARQIWSEGGQGELPGVTVRTGSRSGYEVTTVEILDQEGAEALGKPVGKYVTVELTGLAQRAEEAFPRAVETVSAELRALLPPGEGTVLVVGLGNRAITPDDIGPGAVDAVLVTRHLVEGEPVHFGDFRPVAALAAGVMASTGMESGELVGAVAARLHPCCVVAIDALAARSVNRVCTTVQLTDTGIVPGSGVGNARAALNAGTLGVPVIAVGVPTVVDGATLAADLLERVGGGGPDVRALREVGGGLMVTPRDIDQRVAELAKGIGYAVTLALQPRLTLSDLELLLS